MNMDTVQGTPSTIPGFASPAGSITASAAATFNKLYKSTTALFSPAANTRGASKDLRQKLTQARQLILGLEQRLASAQDAIEVAEKAKAAAVARADGLEQRLTAAKESADETSFSTSSLEQELDRLTAVVKSRDAELEALHAKYTTLGRELREAQTTLTAELATEREARAEAATALAKVQAENKSLSEAVDGYEERIQQAGQEQSDLRSEHARKLRALEDSTREREAAVKHAMRWVPAAHTKITAVRQELTGMKSSLSESMAAAKADFDRLGGMLLRGVGSVAREAALANKRFMRESKERRRVFNQLQELRGNIRVFCRVRPVLPKETRRGLVPLVAAEEDTTILVADAPLPEASASGSGELVAPAGKRFEFDRVFGATSTQQEVYDEVSPMVHSALDGFHCCIFAYGQTGSGKTHTMQGQDSEEGRGVYSRALAQLFEETVARTDSHSFSLTVSMVEIYNEQVRDLLVAPGASSKNLDIRTGPSGNYMPDAVVEPVHCSEDVAALMERGACNRSVGATDANEHSSRSHSLLLINIHGTNRVTGAQHHGRLVLVDLAGSERVSKSGATGQRMKEAQNINKSLSALGDVIGALTHKSGHVPFRNSKLTYLLADSLGQDNKALMIVQVSPVEESKSETMCSLNFATRVRKVEQGQARKHGDSSDTSRMRAALSRAKAEAKAASEQAAGLQSMLSSLKSAGAKAKAEAKAASAAAERATDATASVEATWRAKLEAADKALKEERKGRVEATKRAKRAEEALAKAEKEATKRAEAGARTTAKRAASATAAAEKKAAALAAENKSLQAALERKDAAIAKAKAARAPPVPEASGEVKALAKQVKELRAALAEAEARAAAAEASAPDDEIASLCSTAGAEETLRGIEDLQQAVRASMELGEGATKTGGSKRPRADPSSIPDAAHGGPSPEKLRAVDDDAEAGPAADELISDCDSASEAERDEDEDEGEEEGHAGAFAALNDTFSLRRAGPPAASVVEADSDEDEYTPAAEFFESMDAPVTPPAQPGKPRSSTGKQEDTPAQPSTASRVKFGTSAGLATDATTPGRKAAARRAGVAPHYSKRSALGKSPKVAGILRKDATETRSGRAQRAPSTESAPPLKSVSNTVTGGRRRTKAPRESRYAKMGAAFKSVGIKSTTTSRPSTSTIYSSKTGRPVSAASAGGPARRGTKAAPARRVTRTTRAARSE